LFILRQRRAEIQRQKKKSSPPNAPPRGRNHQQREHLDKILVHQQGVADDWAVGG